MLPDDKQHLPALPNFGLALIRVAAFRLSQNAHSQPTGWVVDALKILKSTIKG
jgi:hypothetical protein